MSQPKDGLVLKPIEISGLPARIEIPSDGVALGRSPENNVVLDAERFPQVGSPLLIAGD